MYYMSSFVCNRCDEVFASDVLLQEHLDQVVKCDVVLNYADVHSELFFDKIVYINQDLIALKNIVNNV